MCGEETGVCVVRCMCERCACVSEGCVCVVRRQVRVYEVCVCGEVFVFGEVCV